MNCTQQHTSEIENGTSKKLADKRSEIFSNLSYELFFKIPDSLSEPIEGTNTIELELKNKPNNLIFDFKNPESSVTMVKPPGYFTPAIFGVI